MRLLCLALPLAMLGLGADDPPARKLAMTPAVACAKITAFGDFVPLDEAVVTRDDKLLVYYEPSGFLYETVGKEYRVHFIQDARIHRRGQRASLFSKDKLLDYTGKSKQPPLNVYLTNTIALKDLAPGEYDLEIILHDEVAKGLPATQNLKFRVKTAEPIKP